MWDDVKSVLGWIAFLAFVALGLAIKVIEALAPLILLGFLIFAALWCVGQFFSFREQRFYIPRLQQELASQQLRLGKLASRAGQLAGSADVVELAAIETLSAQTRQAMSDTSYALVDLLNGDIRDLERKFKKSAGKLVQRTSWRRESYEFKVSRFRRSLEEARRLLSEAEQSHASCRQELAKHRELPGSDRVSTAAEGFSAYFGKWQRLREYAKKSESNKGRSRTPHNSAAPADQKAPLSGR